jgi:hypothetical protein
MQDCYPQSTKLLMRFRWEMVLKAWRSLGERITLRNHANINNWFPYTLAVQYFIWSSCVYVSLDRLSQCQQSASFCITHTSHLHKQYNYELVYDSQCLCFWVYQHDFSDSVFSPHRQTGDADPSTGVNAICPCLRHGVSWGTQSVAWNCANSSRVVIDSTIPVL